MNDAPPITTEQEIPVRLAIVAHDGDQIAYDSGITWLSSNTDVFEVIPNQQNGLEALVKSVGVGEATLTVSVTISVGGVSHDVEIEGKVVVTGEAGAYTATLEWGDPRPKTEATPEPSGEQTS